jgi:uncharacterized protein YdaU (DUF1376 family)
MHYYKRNLGDYAKKAGRLTMLQHGAYTLLIDSCYDREVFPTLEQALEWTWASTEAEVDAVKFVLNRFFVLDKDGCYVQDRILEELLHYHKNADTNKRIAEEREAKRREKRTNRAQDVNEAPPNHKPLTTNQEPLTKNHIKKATVVATPDGVSEIVWKEFVNHRKSKKAQITQTVINEIAKQANMAGWTLEDALKETIVRNWQSFKADWVASKTTFAQQAADIARTTVPGKQERDPALVKLDQDKLITKPPSLETLQKIAMLRTK